MKRLFLLFVLCGLFVGCEEFLPTTQLPNGGNNNTNEEHSCPLVFDIESEGYYIIDVAPEGREVDIKIRTNVEYGFSIPSDAKSWISITGTRADVSERGVTFEVAENTSTESRETVILFTQKDGELLYAVHFRQFGIPTVDDIFTIAGEGGYTIDVDAAGDMKYLDVTTNCGCNVVIPEESRYWISLAESRTEPAVDSHTLAFVIAENVLSDERKATVELQDNDGRTMFEVTFRQKGNDAQAPIFKIAKVESYEASPNGGKVHIAVTTNIDYTVNIASGAQSWLSVADTRSELSVGVVTLVAQKNDTNAKRSGVVTFKDMDGNTLESVTISQEISNFDIVVENAEGLVCMPGASVNIAYSIVGGGNNPKIEAFGDSGWSAEVSATSADKGSIKVTAPEGASSGKIVILAISTTGESITKSVYFNEGVLTGVVDTYTVDYTACTLEVKLKTNLEYSVNIPAEAQSWISVADTRASLRSETLTFTIAENPDDMPRNAIIELVGECNDVLQKFTIAQKLQPSGDYIEFADQYVKKVCVQKYDKNGDGELSYKEAAEVTSIPEYFFGDYDKTVTSFNELQYFTNVTGIGNNAFDGCSNLKSIAIPEKVTWFGWAAFENCSSLKSVYITDLSAWCKIDIHYDNSSPLCSAGADLYINGELATEITIPSDITTLYKYAFRGCTSLEKVFIHDGVTSINQDAFLGCSSLTSVNIPNSVTSIGSAAFYDCEALESVTLPENITKIDSQTFYNCKSLKSIIIPDNVVKIGNNAFEYCYALESVTIGSGVTAIDDYAFNGCSSLTSITIPDSVTTIGDYAFNGCSNLTSVNIPKNLIKIEDYTFYGCSSIESITLPDGIISIGDGAFEECDALTEVTIPSSLVSMGEGAFRACDNIEKFSGNFATEDGYALIIDNELKAFAYSCGASEYAIPNGVTTIDSHVFYACQSITQVTIPNSVTKIESRAFLACANLISVYCKAITPPAGSYDMFSNNASGRKIYVPTESVEAYKSASYWSSYKSYIVGCEF